MKEQDARNVALNIETIRPDYIAKAWETLEKGKWAVEVRERKPWKLELHTVTEASRFVQGFRKA